MKWLPVALPVLFITLGLPLWLGAVPPNRWYGYRTATTLQDPVIWYAINRETGVAMVAAGAVALLLSLAVLFGMPQWRNETRTLLCLIAQAIVLLLALAVVVLRAERL